ncbi:MAG: Ldh family oxidoreductase, partial [Bacteroidia bacterium]
MDKWIETFRAAKPAKGHDRVLIPGDIERGNEERISKEGIHVIEPVQREMKEIAEELGIEFNYQG